VALRLCDGRGCKSKKRVAVYLVNQHPMCSRCLELFLEFHGEENYTIHRLSSRDEDYSPKTHLRPVREAQTAGA